MNAIVFVKITVTVKVMVTVTVTVTVTETVTVTVTETVTIMVTETVTERSVPLRTYEKRKIKCTNFKFEKLSLD